MVTLVTGGTGFIGGHLVERLVGKGEDVRCLVKRDSNTKRLKELGAEITYGDIRDVNSIKSAMENVERVYHLAALARMYANLTPRDYTEVNVKGTANVLEACRGADVEHVVYTSSTEAVGPSPDGKPLTEQSPCRPQTIYGESKLGGEIACKEYAEKYNLPITIIRPPMIYGPGNVLHLSRLFKVVRRGFYPIVGSGNSLMEFCYVGNQVQGIILAGEEKKAIGQTYFISDERPYTITEILNTIAEAEGVKLRIIRMPSAVGYAIGALVEGAGKVLPVWPFKIRETGRPTFSRNTVRWTTRNTWFVSTEKAKKELGYRPETPLKEGVRKTVEWYKSIGAL
ncbi:MAG: NAD-dependent epimerase/dehydratase family protein [Candidatus Aenigmatarchaeota archaeon]